MYATAFTETTLECLPLPHHQVSCFHFNMHSAGLATGLREEELQRLDQLILRCRRVLRNETLFAMGDPLSNLYLIRLGHFKTHEVRADGSEQIMGFPMTGDMLGLDGIGTGRHICYAVALEESEVCEIPFDRLQQLVSEIPALLLQFHRMLGQEISRDHSIMHLLGTMRAEQRFASFLLKLSADYQVRGYSPTHFQLRMSREDIANQLGLTIESISRLILRFKARRWITVNQREVVLLDLAALRQAVDA